MKRVMDMTENLVRLVAFMAGLSAAAAPLPSDWQRAQTFDVSTAGLVKISLPVETLDSARPALKDLRLYDGAGGEIPYVIERPAPAPKIARAAKSFHVSLNPDTTVITLETGMSQPLDGVTLETPANNFIKAVRVESSEDGQRWQTLAQGQPVFRQPDGPGHLEISWPAGVSTWLRLTADDRRSKPVPFTGARVQAAASGPAPGEWMPVRISERDENPGETRLSLDLGTANLDLAALEIETAEPLFLRPVRVAVPLFLWPARVAEPRLAADAIREQPIGQGVIYRVDVPGQTPAGNLSVPLEQIIRSRELVVFIKNGDSSPLPISGARVERRPARLVFLARQTGTFYLLTGNYHCAAPRYDLAGLHINLQSVAVSPVQLSPPSNNPDFRAPEFLKGVDLGGAASDVSEWRFRKAVRISGAGVQQLELDPDVLAHAQAGLGDVRVLRGSNQVPYIVERTSIHRSLAPAVTVTNDAKDPKLSRWILRVPRARLPLVWLACVARTPLFERSMSLYEELAGERGETYRHALGGGSWRQTPERAAKEFSLPLEGDPQSDTLLLETENGDNPPIDLERFQVFYPATRLLFKAKPGDELFLYYGQPQAAPPRYDLSLVADQLLAADKNPASLSGEEQLKITSWRENPMPGQGGVLFWGALAAVVAALLILIARLLPKSPPPAKS
jgi:hypothetical protein